MFRVRPERKEQGTENWVVVSEKKLLWLHLLTNPANTVKIWLARTLPDSSFTS